MVVLTVILYYVCRTVNFFLTVLCVCWQAINYLISLVFSGVGNFPCGNLNIFISNTIINVINSIYYHNKLLLISLMPPSMAYFLY